MTRKRLKCLAASNSMEVDRISYLPEAILHHILSFLPAKDVYRTSVLSKTFLSSWTTFPALVLNYFTFGGDFDEIMDVLYRNIQRKKLRETYLEKFDLTIPFLDYHPRTDYRVDEAICFAVTNQLKELSLILNVSGFYKLPLITGSFNSITSLRLKGLELTHFDHLMACCLHAIKTLCIEECSGLAYFNFSSITVTSVELRHCVGLETINIESPSLEKFIYDDRLIPHSSARTANCGIIDISSCKFLKVLKLVCASVTDEWVEDNVTQLRQLEDLSLAACHKLNRLTISNDNLKRLELKGFSSSLRILEIVGTSLESLNFIGSSTCKIRFDTPLLVSFLSSYVKVYSDRPYITEHRGYATLSISTNGPLPESYFVTLREFIRSLFVHEVLTLVCSSSKDLVIPEKVRGKVIHPCNILKHVRILGGFSISTELVDSLLWLFPFARTFCFVSDEENKLIEVTDSEPKGRRIDRKRRIDVEDDLACCSSLCRKCWRHSSKTIELKNFDTSDSDNLRKYFMENARSSMK